MQLPQDPDLPDTDSRTAMMASLEGQVEVGRLLLEAWADTNVAWQ